MFRYLNLFVLLVLILIPSTVGSAVLKETVNIIHVHSYDIQHPCTYPQMIGFNKKINSLEESQRYKINTKIYFMDSKTKNISTNQQHEVANIILRYIKEQKPDFVYVTDDVAFEYVGIPAATLGFKVIASGMNKQIQSYVIDKFITPNALKNIYACEEYIHLDDIFFIFENIRFKPYKWYVLYDDSETSYYMMQNYERELIGKGNFVPVQILTTKELEDFLKEIQKEKKSVLVLTIQSITNEKNKRLSKDQFINIFFKENTKHLELSANMIFSKFGAALASGPDFEDMGSKSASYIINQVLPNGWKPDVSQPVTKTAVNKQRLKELGFERVTDMNTRQIKIFENY